MTSGFDKGKRQRQGLATELPQEKLKLLAILQRKSPWKRQDFNRAYGTANIADDYDYDESAYVANDWDAEPWDEVDNDPAYHSEEEPYLGDDGQEEEETEDAVEAEELNCMAHLADTFGDGVWDEKNAAEASEYVQSSTVAFVAFGKKGKGKGKGKKGKGSYPIRPSNLSIQDRRNKLQELKNRTECKECGRRGHWAGDAACTMTKAGQSKQRIASVACNDTVGSAPEPQEDACVCCLSDASDTEKTTLMAYKQKPVPITPSNRLRFPKAVAYQPIGKAPPPQWQDEWQMIDQDEVPVTTAGQDHVIFTIGTFKGCRFIDVLNQHPEQYLTARNSKVLPREMQAFVDWVNKFYSVNPKTKKVTLVAELAPRTVQGQVHTGPSICPCTNVHHSGSSARYHRTTCRDCGSVTQVEKVVEHRDPATCPHTNTNHRGSNKYVHKTYCKDCGTVTDTIAQSVHKDIKAMQEEVGEVSLEEAALLSRVTNHDIVTKAEILTAAKIFMQEVEQLEEGEYQLLNICHLFLDGSDRACEQVRARDLANAGARLQQVDPSAQIGGHFMQADHTSAFVSGGPYHGRQVFEGNAQSSQDQEHVAHMAVKGGPYKDSPYNRDDDARASAFHDAVGQRQDCPLLESSSSEDREHEDREPREPTMQEYQTTKLRVVDPITDEGVWAIVDDACNSSCHGRSWRLNAEEKWKKKGFNSFVRSSKPTTFKGVGNAQTAGKLHVPFATKLVESGMIIPGGMDSHELPTADHPMLISQSVQARLGMIKCIRNGIIWLQDYDNQTLEVVRHYKTGLFMIRIDYLWMITRS